MSSQAQPIDPARFAAALESLEIGSLHEKAAELRNQMAHLKSSNDQLLPFAQEGDQDCDDAIKENLEVIARMNVRLDLLRSEVERRGMLWVENEPAKDVSKVNGEGSTSAENGGARNVQSGTSGRLSDDELARRLRERMPPESDHEDEDGVHL